MDWLVKMYKISDEVVKSIEYTMENWRVELTVGGKSLNEVKIQLLVFQGYALSPLILMLLEESLVHFAPFFCYLLI